MEAAREGADDTKDLQARLSKQNAVRGASTPDSTGKIPSLIPFPRSPSR